MAKLTLKALTTDKGFDIEQKQFKLPFVKEKIELIITPHASRSIDYKDFVASSLPAQVSRVKFNNSGGKVIATVFINRKIKSSKNITLSMLVRGKALHKLDLFSIFETTNTLGNISVTGFSSNNKTTTGNKTEYNVRNSLGNKSLVFSKTFTIEKGFMFSTAPTCVISGDSKRYKVVTKVKKTNNKISSKTFSVYYTSPDTANVSKNTNISFSALAQSTAIKPRIKVATKESQNKIYGIDKGIDPGPQGGIKTMTVKGIPGSTYSFLVSNSDGEMYNVKTGTFSDEGGLIQGVVPVPRRGKTYGESVVRINIPRSASAQTISTQFIQNQDVDIVKAKINKAVAGSIASIITPTKVQAQEVVSLTTPTLTFTVSRNSAVLTDTGVNVNNGSGYSITTSSQTVEVDTTTATDTLFRGKKVYKSDGTLFGTCTNVTATTLVFNAGLSAAMADDDSLYTYPDIYLGPKVKVLDRGETITSQDIFLGKEGREVLQFKKPGQYKLDFVVSPGVVNKVVQITRQPLFVMPTYPDDNFIAWDSDATKKILAQQADGTTIPSDWDWSAVDKRAKVEMKFSVVGVGKIVSTDAISGVDHYSYSSVRVSGEIRVGGTGKAPASVDLKLDNFLSIIERS